MNDILQNREQAISPEPNTPESYIKRGIAFSKLMRYDDAIASFDKAIQMKPDSPQAYNSRGNSLQALRRFDEAIESYSRAIVLKADYAMAYANRGNAFQWLQRYDEAIDSYGKAIALKPDYVDAYNNRGTAFKQLKRFDEALADFDNAIALLPDRAELYSNRGNALQELKLFDHAIESYNIAISLSPDRAKPYSNRGVALRELGRFDEAIESFNKALALKQDYDEAIWNRALVYLQTGRFDLGWRDYEARKKKRQPVGNRRFEKPEWLGQSEIFGRTILVHWEQGLGDVIQFCRYIRLLNDAGATVLFAPQKELESLMRRLDAHARIVNPDVDRLEFDLHCPLLSLPLAFRTDLSSVPNAIYLSADRERLGRWADRLGKKSRPRIGVVWRGNPIPDSNRSIALDRFGRLLGSPIEFISLQKEVTDVERAWLTDARVLHLGDEISDFSDTAALCVLVDLVISVDTSVAHLAGALGVPVWVLLTAVPDWRWLLDREDSPWYPSMRLFRQKTRGDWGSVLQRVEKEIAVRFLSGWSG